MIRLAVVNGLLTRVETTAAPHMKKDKDAFEGQGRREEVSEPRAAKCSAEGRSDLDVSAPGELQHEVRLAYVYSHGFPDSSVLMTKKGTSHTIATHVYEKKGIHESVLEERSTAQDSRCKDDYFRSRVPRILCECLLQGDVFLSDDASSTPNPDEYSESSRTCPTAFVCFNTNGLHGSYGEFQEKCLMKDIVDIHTIVCYTAAMFPRAVLVLLGLSTGAFLTAAYLSGKVRIPEDVWRNGLKETLITSGTAQHGSENFKLPQISEFLRTAPIKTAVTIALVDDIPESYSVDFVPKQLSQFRADGFCVMKKYDLGYPQESRMGRQYVASYQYFPHCEEMVRGINVPMLLIHGSADKCVPVRMAYRLNAVFDEHPVSECGISRSCELHIIDGANHLLSKPEHMAEATSIICSFIRRNALSQIDRHQ